MGACQQRERHSNFLSYLTGARYAVSAVSLLVVAQPSSEFPEGLMNYPVLPSIGNKVVRVCSFNFTVKWVDFTNLHHYHFSRIWISFSREHNGNTTSVLILAIEYFQIVLVSCDERTSYNTWKHRHIILYCIIIDIILLYFILLLCIIIYCIILYFIIL